MLDGVNSKHDPRAHAAYDKSRTVSLPPRERTNNSGEMVLRANGFFSDSEASANLFPSAWRVANCVGARAYGIGFDLIAWLLGRSVETMNRERALLYSNFMAK